MVNPLRIGWEPTHPVEPGTITTVICVSYWIVINEIVEMVRYSAWSRIECLDGVEAESECRTYSSVIQGRRLWKRRGKKSHRHVSTAEYRALRSLRNA